MLKAPLNPTYHPSINRLVIWEAEFRLLTILFEISLEVVSSREFLHIYKSLILKIDMLHSGGKAKSRYVASYSFLVLKCMNQISYICSSCRPNSWLWCNSIPLGSTPYVICPESPLQVPSLIHPIHSFTNLPIVTSGFIKTLRRRRLVFDV